MKRWDHSCCNQDQGQSTLQYIQQYLRVYMGHCKAATEDGVKHEQIPTSNIKEESQDTSDSWHIPTARLRWNIEWNWLDPCMAANLVSWYAKKIDQAASIPIYSVHPVSLLDYWDNKRNVGRWLNVPLPTVVDNHRSHNVPSVNDGQMYRNQLWYKISSKQYGLVTWKPVEVLDGMQMLRENQQWCFETPELMEKFLTGCYPQQENPNPSWIAAVGGRWVQRRCQGRRKE